MSQQVGLNKQSTNSSFVKGREMRNTLASIPCDDSGRIHIMGVEEGTVTFLAVGLRITGNLKKHLDVASGIKCSIVTTTPINTMTAVFQCDIKGEVRNPRGLLKSVRSRLHGAIVRAHRDDWEDSEISTYDADKCMGCERMFWECDCSQDIPDPCEIYPRNDG